MCCNIKVSKAESITDLADADRVNAKTSKPEVFYLKSGPLLSVSVYLDFLNLLYTTLLIVSYMTSWIW